MDIKARSAKVDTGFASERALIFKNRAFSSREPGPTSLENALVACRRVKRASHQRNLGPDQLFVRCRSALFALPPSEC
jgi:hypothetical protein